MSYATWEYYSGSHTAVQTEQEFTRLSRIAARKIDVFTGQRAAGAAGYKADAVRECECQLVDYLHAAEATAQGQGIYSPYPIVWIRNTKLVQYPTKKSICQCFQPR